MAQNTAGTVYRRQNHFVEGLTLGSFASDGLLDSSRVRLRRRILARRSRPNLALSPFLSDISYLRGRTRTEREPFLHAWQPMRCLSV